MLPAAHAVHFCGNVTGFLACQIDIHRRQLCRLASPLHWRLLTKLRNFILGLTAGNLQRCPDRARRDNIHANSFFRHLFRQAAAVIKDCRLGCRIIQQVRTGLIRLDRRRCDNTGAFWQQRNRFLGYPEQGKNVNGEGLLKLLAGQIFYLRDCRLFTELPAPECPARPALHAPYGPANVRRIRR